MPYCGQDWHRRLSGTPSPEGYIRTVDRRRLRPGHAPTARSVPHAGPGPSATTFLAATKKKAIELRYRLIPYLPSPPRPPRRALAPLMRPLVLESSRPKTFDLEGPEWLVGDRRQLAAPVLAQGGAREVYLPAGQWYEASMAPVNGGENFMSRPLWTPIPSHVQARNSPAARSSPQATGLGVERSAGSTRLPPPARTPHLLP